MAIARQLELRRAGQRNNGSTQRRDRQGSCRNACRANEHARLLATEGAVSAKGDLAAWPH
jgi:hypothetical protein